MGNKHWEGEKKRRKRKGKCWGKETGRENAGEGRELVEVLGKAWGFTGANLGKKSRQA